MTLQNLEGSEKQIALAEKIRTVAFKRLDQVEKVVSESVVKFKATPERVAKHEREKQEKLFAIAKKREFLESQVSSKFWIEASSTTIDWAEYNRDV